METTPKYKLTFPSRGEPMRLGRAHFQGNAETTEAALAQIEGVAETAASTASSSAATVAAVSTEVRQRTTKVETDLAAVLAAVAGPAGTGGNLDAAVAALVGIDSATAQAVRVPAEVADKRGAGWWAAQFAPPAAADTPAVSVATSPAITGGTAVLPTADYFGDLSFRYDGAADITADGAGFVKAVQPATLGAVYALVPEFVTSPGCDRVDVKVTLNAAGSSFGLRVIIDGRWLTLPLQWFPTTPSTVYYVRLAFPTGRARQIRIEGMNVANFGGVIVPAGETVTRPAREIRKRMVILGDSYTVGANGNTTTDPATNGCSRFETFPNYVARLLGCDSVLNLGSGGTGWVLDASKSTFGQRIPDVLAANPHIVLAVGSRNDIAATGPQVYAAALAALTQLADVPVVTVGGLGDAGSTSPGATAPAVLNDAVQQAARAAGRPFHDVLGVVTPALKNTADNVHPSVIGAQVLGAAFYGLMDRPPLDEAVAAAVGGLASTDLTLTVTPPAVAASGGAVTLTATQSTARAGRVAFYANGVLLGVSTLTAGVATFSTSTLPAGSYTLLARFRPANPLQVKPTTAPPIAGYRIATNLGFTDTFTRADGPVGSTENGKPYTTTGQGTFTVSSGKLINGSVASGTSYCVADAGTPNGTLSVTITGTTPNAAILALRYLGSTNLLRLTVQSGQIVLQQVVDNVSTTLATGSTGSWASGDVLTAVAAGNSITVKRNGTTVPGLAAVQVPTRFAGYTMFGVAMNTGGASSGLTYDDLTFTV